MRQNLILACLLVAAPTPARAVVLDLGAKTSGALVRSEAVIGGGGGVGLCAALSLWRPFPRAALGLAADLQLLFGFGPTVAVGVGPFLRYAVGRIWTPELGLTFQYLGGSLVRYGDAEGRLPRDPVALQLGLAPLRFTFAEQRTWVSLLAARYGWTLVAASSSLALTVSLVEAGWTF